VSEGGPGGEFGFNPEGYQRGCRRRRRQVWLGRDTGREMRGEEIPEEMKGEGDTGGGGEKEILEGGFGWAERPEG